VTAAIKSGAKLGGLKPEALAAWFVASTIFEKYGVPCVLTEGSGGKHMANSLHYTGYAVDLRVPSWYGPQSITDEKLAAELRAALGLEYDVVLELPETPGATGGHIHVEWDPPITGRNPA
jgi:hypothetical protein